MCEDNLGDSRLPVGDILVRIWLWNCTCISKVFQHTYILYNFIAKKTNNICPVLYLFWLSTKLWHISVCLTQNAFYFSADTKNLTLTKTLFISYRLKFESLVSETSEVCSTFWWWRGWWAVCQTKRKVGRN